MSVTDRVLAGIIDDPTGVNSQTVLAIATELQALRAAADPGTPPDFQEWGHAYADDSVNLNTAMVTRDQLSAKGCTWFRVQKIDDLIYIDGWRTRPEKEATFVNTTHHPVVKS